MTLSKQVGRIRMPLAGLGCDGLIKKGSLCQMTKLIGCVQMGDDMYYSRLYNCDDRCRFGSFTVANVSATGRADCAILIRGVHSITGLSSTSVIQAHATCILCY